VVSYCRIDDAPIRAHDPLERPGVVVVQDPTLLRSVDVLAGLTEDGVVVVNSSRRLSDLVSAGLVLHGRQRALCVPASEMARERLGRPLPNTALIGAVVAVTGAVGRTALHAAIRTRFVNLEAHVVDANLQLATDAFERASTWERDRA
jgi:pyruvate ferredoxin oxidoreductase gamma subunit